jgi:hypothetical protein
MPVGFFPAYRCPTVLTEREEDFARASAAQVAGKEGCIDE